MWDTATILATVFAGLTGTGIFVGAVMSILTYRATGEIHVMINSRMDELLRATKESANLTGRQEQRDEEKKGPSP
jgi:hypothetical protein